MIEEKLKRKYLLSVVVLDNGGCSYWFKLFKAFKNQSCKNFEIIIIENGAPVELPKGFDDLDVVKFRPGKNLGFAAGCNLGWELASGQTIVFLNNDAVPDSNWLERLVSVMALDEKVGAVCSKVLFERKFVRLEIVTPTFVPSRLDENLTDVRELGIRIALNDGGVTRYVMSGVHGVELEGGEDWVWTSGRATVYLPLDDDGTVRMKFDTHPAQNEKSFWLGWIDGSGESIELDRRGVRELVFDGQKAGASYLVNNAGSEIQDDWHVTERGLYEPDDGKYDSAMDLEAASACSLAVKRSALKGEQVFDSEFFAYYEDVDLSRRLRNSGYRIVYEPTSIVYHKRSGTAGTQSAFQVFHATRNRFWVIAKHAPWKVVAQVLWGEMRDLERYTHWLDEEYSISRLKRETWLGFLKRLWWRLCDSE